MMNDDMDLLRDYAARQSEQAFATLVARHIHLVHSAALRQVRDPHLAGEITQTVFIILARKADSLGPKTILSGWLYRTAQFVSKAALKREFRRRLREQEAHMQAITDPDQTGSTWEQLSPFLDEAMAQLRDKDRDAIVLRYFENRSLKEIGGALGVEERAAQKRVARGLEKLRKFFVKRGIASTTATIAGAISANSVQAAPIELAKTISAVAIAKGAAASTSTLTLIKGALKLMAWTKIKTAIVAGVVVLLAAGTTTVTIHENRKPKFNPNDFWTTSYPTISGSSETIRFFTNSFGHELDSSFSASPVQLCSISGLLNQCMEVSGWRYLIDKNVSAGSVKFGSQKEMTGKEWVEAFENVLQTGSPEWWDVKTKRMHRENLVLIRFPEQKVVLVLPKDKAAKYQ